MNFDKKALKYRLKEDFDLCLVPKSPGVYIFFDETGKAIYVGKAKILRNRISSYLRNSAAHTPKTSVMLKKAAFLDMIVTASEKEALILEAELIGELKPRYNIRLRDDKSYPFLRVGMGSSYPGLGIVRKRRKDGALYFGPYTSSLELRRTLNLITSVFRLRTCSDLYMKNRTRPCLKYQVGKCLAPCVGKVSMEDYQVAVSRLRAFLNGQTGQVVRGLREEMKRAASALDFERAAILRDSIKAIEGVVEAQSVVSKRGLCLDVWALEQQGSNVQAALLKVREGVLRQKQVFGVEVGLEKDMGRIYFDFITLFYAKAEIPAEVVVPDVLDDDMLQKLSSFLSELRGKRAVVRTGARGIRKRLLDTARMNACQKLDLELSRAREWEGLSDRMKELFSLKNRPEHVEGIDISNTSGSEAIGSLVCFKNGKADKSLFRQYNMRTKGPNDYAMIREVVERRIERGLRAGDLPNLMIIDGGRGQLSMALDAAREKGVLHRLDIISLAKEHGLEGEKIYLPGRVEPVILPRQSKVLRFCQLVRDEAHRFGISRHRKRRRKKAVSSVISKIPGVGAKRHALLVNHFGSTKALASASLSELEAVPGLPSSVAKNIYYFFRSSGSTQCQE